MSKNIKYVVDKKTCQTLCPYGEKSVWNWPIRVGSIICVNRCIFFVSHNKSENIIECCGDPLSKELFELKEN